MIKKHLLQFFTSSVVHTNVLHRKRKLTSSCLASLLHRYEENKANKIPCAQPRASLSMSPPPVVGSALIDDQVYQNFNDAKKSATREYETDG